MARVFFTRYKELGGGHCIIITHFIKTSTADHHFVQSLFHCVFIHATLLHMCALNHRFDFFDGDIRFQWRQCGDRCSGDPGIIHFAYSTLKISLKQPIIYTVGSKVDD